MHRLLKNASGPWFTTWCLIASFGTYFCMYAFRKPMSTGLYPGYTLFGMGYKPILIISQVLGYMTSKFIGIKVISELRPGQRVRLIIGLVAFSAIALLFFGLVPYPYNFIFLFFNGLPLGMIWGVVFSFLEGRKYTEVLSIGLSISIIAASGILKTIYLVVHGWFPHISEFWLPFTMGAIFFPFFCFFVWMLSVIPAPTESDKQLRAERPPMTDADKRNVLRQYGPGIACMMIVYCMLATMRDFRDNFSVEIWNELDTHWSKAVLAQTEVICSIIVLMAVGALSLVRNNEKAFHITIGLILSGIVIGGVSTLLYHVHMISGFNWMLWLGMGLFLAYVPVQVALFERMIALFHIRANAGYFVYLCDAMGYLGSVGILFYKEFFARTVKWSDTMAQFSCVMTIGGGILLLFCIAFFKKALLNKEIGYQN
jgi:MFS family permease